MTTLLKTTMTFALALLASSALAQEKVGVIKRSTGHVLIERSGVRVAAPPGTDVRRGDRLITGADGQAIVSMRRTSPLSVGPSNDVALDRFAMDDDPVVKRAAPAILQSLASFLAVNRQR